jgi:protein-disulfide isomerase
MSCPYACFEMKSAKAKKLLGVALGLLWFASTAVAQDPAVADQTKPGTPAARSGISQEQADSILSELRQIRQLLEKQQAQLTRVLAPRSAAPAPPDKVQMSLAGSWFSIGRADAPVTLIEFGDFQCPYCRRFHAETYPELKKNYIDTGKMRFIARDMPLDFHPFAMKAAVAGRCAGEQGKYWEMRDTLFAHAAELSYDAILKFAQAISLDAASFKACVDADKHKSEIQADQAEAAALRINGTPTFVVGKTAGDKLDGSVLVGALPYAAFDSAIQQVLKGNPASPDGKAN